MEVLGVRADQLTGLTVAHRWEPADAPTDHPPKTWRLDGDADGIADALVRAGHRVTRDPDEPGDGVVFVPRGIEEDLHRLAAITGPGCGWSRAVRWRWRAVDVRNPLLRALSPAEGVRALEAVPGSGRVATGVVRFDRGAVVELFPELGRRPFFSGVLAVAEGFGGGGGVVRVLREGAGVPVHLFHPAGGPTSVYRPLAELLGDRSCYGYERLDDVPDIAGKAQRYVEWVRSVQPDGPYS